MPDRSSEERTANEAPNFSTRFTQGNFDTFNGQRGLFDTDRPDSFNFNTQGVLDAGDGRYFWPQANAQTRANFESAIKRDDLMSWLGPALFAGGVGAAGAAGVGLAAEGIGAAAGAPAAEVAGVVPWGGSSIPMAGDLGGAAAAGGEFLMPAPTPGQLFQPQVMPGEFPMPAPTAPGAPGAPSLPTPSGGGNSGGAGNTPLDPSTGGLDVGDGGPSFIPAVNQLSPLATEQATALGISGASPSSAVASGGGSVPGGAGLLGSEAAGGAAEDSWLEMLKRGGSTAMDWLKKNPGTGLMLGQSALTALSKPKLPDAAKALQAGAIPGAASANAVIQAGGAGGPQWGQQKASIDATIDQRIQQAQQQLLQNAQNSGTGVDSQVTVQQINKMKIEAEAVRQQMYMQAQQQNVQAALSALGINNSALNQVAGMQFGQSRDAQTAAMQTAQLALQLQQLQKGTAGATKANPVAGAPSSVPTQTLVAEDLEA